MSSVRPVAAAVCALSGPGMLVVRALRTGQWAPPPSATGRAMLGAYVLAVAVVEETLYRGPVSRCAGKERRVAPLVTAAASVSGFVALHVRRDGRRAVLPHLVNAGCWTGSALLGRTIRWSIAAHSAYNYAAMSVRARP